MRQVASPAPSLLPPPDRPVQLLAPAWPSPRARAAEPSAAETCTLFFSSILLSNGGAATDLGKEAPRCLCLLRFRSCVLTAPRLASRRPNSE